MRGQVFIAASALMGAMLIAQPAAAQQYRSYHDETVSRHEQCQRSQQNRQIGGAIIGGIAGALLGREVADRGVRGEGAAVGAVVGAITGAGVGRATAECDTRVQGNYDPYYGQPERRPYGGGAYEDDYYGDNSGLRGGPGYRQSGYRQECRQSERVAYDRRGRAYREPVTVCRGRDGEWREQR
ncbi:MAG TPA: glycine zipper domain-containing protein [Terricaulis sp.]|nr:glycine zipper domain-containing protein [Terricaulis sp.]